MHPDNETATLTELDPLIGRFLSNRAQFTLTRAPLTGVSTFFRSKIFTANTGVNPLVASASVLFTLMTRLKSLEADRENLQTLYAHLTHEMSAFETAAHNHGYRSETILLARYLLCAALDEAITQTSWVSQAEWENHSLLLTFQNEPYGGERFFLILERLTEDPALHIDLLELIYLCLSLGFQGKYHSLEDGKTQLDDLRDALYQTIRQQRGNIKKELLIHAKGAASPSKPSQARNITWLLFFLFVTAAAVIIFVRRYL